ncbi:MAG TPA: ATP-dependent DNA ligase, partial [Verrucomicrobiae bacterium]|nr:ATP-dependent DNA ligase [Verrucomicrobiae bacterium]
HDPVLEWKLDGGRVQVHKEEDEVRVYTRSLAEVTGAVPEVVESVRSLPARSLVLDGEAVSFQPSGVPWPFQVTMRRFGRKLNVEELRRSLPLATFFFDLLYLDGASLLDHPNRERFSALQTLLPPSLLIPRLAPGSPAQAAEFLEEAIRRGHEGVMAKDSGSAYEAGRRGGSWLKVKPAETLDLVVLAAEWGHGRRRAFLSNLHLGARNPESGAYVMLGKTFKGMTDVMLEWQTQKLLEMEIGRDDWTVYVRPELVVEIAFDRVQGSTRYPGGMALRFARVKRYRPDKTPLEADTIEAVRRIFLRQHSSPA